MSNEHFLKSIEAIDEQIAELERQADQHRATVNTLCKLAGIDEKYDLKSMPESGGNNSSKTLSVAPDEYFNKPLATCVRHALQLLKRSSRAPASIETIYDILAAGGYDFGTKVREVGMQGMSVSVGKNSTIFVKLPNGLIGLKEWYGTATRRRPRGKDSDVEEEADNVAGDFENLDAEEAASVNDVNL